MMAVVLHNILHCIYKFLYDNVHTCNLKIIQRTCIYMYNIIHVYRHNDVHVCIIIIIIHVHVVLFYTALAEETAAEGCVGSM